MLIDGSAYAPHTQHHLNNSRSQRVIWLLEELGTPYELKVYKRGADLRAPKELKDVHPLGKSPVITTEDGRVIAESGAIVGECNEKSAVEVKRRGRADCLRCSPEYIIKKYGNGRFKAKNEDLEIDDSFWSHFAEGE